MRKEEEEEGGGGGTRGRREEEDPHRCHRRTPEDKASSKPVHMQHGCWTPSVKLGMTRLYLSQSTDIKVVVTIDKYISKIAYTSTCTSAKTLGMCTNICTDIARAVCNDSAFMSTEISLLLFIDILRHQKAASDRYSASSESNHATKWLHSCGCPVAMLG